MNSTDEVKTCATKLRDVLAGLNCPLKHSESLEIISKLEGYSDWNTLSAVIKSKRQTAEQFLDELMEAKSKVDYLGFTQRMKPKHRENYPEKEFIRDIRNYDEDLGEYVSRKYLGAMTGPSFGTPPTRYPDTTTRHLWLVKFEKNDAFFTIGIYDSDGVTYIGEARIR